MTSAAAALSGEPAAPAAPAVPGLAAPAAPAAPIAPAAPAANGDWFAGITDEGTRTWATAKGWKDPLAAVESAYNLEKLIGFDKAGRTIVVPGEKATPEETRAFYTKLGVPEKADGYKLPVPTGMSDAFAKTASNWFLEAGVPPKSAELITAKWNEYATGVQKAENDKRAQQGELDIQSLKTEWGAAHDQNMELAKRAASQFIPAKDQTERAAILSKIEAAIGTGPLLKMMAGIGAGLGEHKVHQDGTPGGLVMTPPQARQRIEELKSNKDWSKAYLEGDKGKQAEMSRLMQLAYPETA